MSSLGKRHITVCFKYKEIPSHLKLLGKTGKIRVNYEQRVWVKDLCFYIVVDAGKKKPGLVFISEKANVVYLVNLSIPHSFYTKESGGFSLFCLSVAF